MKISLLQRFGIIAGLFLFVFFIFFADDGSGDHAYWNEMAAVASLMAALWMTEALPLAVTSLLPVFLFPFLGIMNAKDVAAEYVNNTVLLFMGGFLLAIAIEKSGLHKRIALMIMKRVGSGAEGILIGLLSATCFISMFINNTATTLMMLPIGMAVIKKMEDKFKPGEIKNFTIIMLLGIAYASSIGGIATLVGTAPNMAFKSIFEKTFPDAEPISFVHWMAYGLPTSLIMMGAFYLLAKYVFFKMPRKLTFDKSLLEEEYKALGRIGYQEKVVLTAFLITAALWTFRENIDLGSFVIPGWAGLFHYGKNFDESTVAIITSFALFIIPAKKNEMILTARAFNDIPWDILLLFGGGFALSAGFQSTGLSVILGQNFAGLGMSEPILITLIVSLIVTFLTELTSNTATTYTVLPILASIAVSMNIDPLYLMIPATISASYGFMMPVGTPPNAIVFGTGRLRMSDMVRPGFFLNLVGIIVVTSVFMLMYNLLH